MDDKQSALISRSGRVRKKSAKLLEIEEAAKPHVGVSAEDGDGVLEDEVKVDDKMLPEPLLILAETLQDEPCSPEDTSVQPSATKFGRVRKKTAKLLESEEIEVLEKKQSSVKKVGPVLGKKGKIKVESSPIPVTPQHLLYNTTSQGVTESGTVRGAKTVRQLLASQSEVKNTKVKGSAAQPNMSESEEGSLKIKFQLGAHPYVKTPSPPEWKEKQPKRRKSEDEVEMPNLPLMGADMESDLTFKLILPATEIKVEEPDKLGLPLVKQEPCKSEKMDNKKKKTSKKALQEVGRSNLLTKVLLNPADQVPPAHLYADSQVKALMVKTSMERKVGHKKKEKFRKDGKPKKRRIATAYTMFCSAKRAEILAEHPGCDFAEISRRLAEKWQSTPGKEKILWKRKARRLATRTQKALEKGLTLNTKSIPRPPQSTKLKSGMSKAMIAQLAPGLQHHSGEAMREAASMAAQTKHDDRNITSSVNPVDAAAHLKLLGESLSIIGFRLQQHQGPIAIQGTMSVLLDSLLCALGPLTALCNYIPTMEGYGVDVDAETLDNIAYFMPGIG